MSLMPSPEQLAQTSIQEDVLTRPPIEGGWGGGPFGALADAWLFNFWDKDKLPLSPWWCRQRDLDLRRYVRGSVLLGGIVNSRVLGLKNMSYTLEANDKAAEALLPHYQAMLDNAQFGAGFRQFLGLWGLDHHTQDNGAFIEWIGPWTKREYRDKNGNRFVALGPLGNPLPTDTPAMARAKAKAAIEGFAHLDAASCLGRDTRVLMADGSSKSILEIVRNKISDPVVCLDDKGNLAYKPITNWYENPLGKRYWIRICLAHARKCFGRPQGLWCTNDHQILTDSGWKAAEDLTLLDKVVTEFPDLNDKQKQVLVGTLLGDAYIQKGRKTKEVLGYALSLTHCTEQRGWLDVKVKAFENLNFAEVGEPRNNIFDTQTLVTPALHSWRDDWYPEGKKIVPREYIENHFSPLMLATWYMDDGNCQRFDKADRTPAIRLYTLGFTSDDNQWLADFLTSKGFRTKVQAVNKKYKGEVRTYGLLYISAKDSMKFFELIAPYVPECMRYKLPENMPAFNPSLWDMGNSPRYCDAIRSLNKDGLDHATTFCIDVADHHNFIAAGMVVHNCWRTYNTEWPIIYRNAYTGDFYILHRTRVSAVSQMQQASELSRGIGFCAVSRAFWAADLIQTAHQYTYEKVTGQAPEIGLLKGIAPEAVKKSLEQNAIDMDAKGRAFFKGLVMIPTDYVGPGADPDIKIIGAKAVPDGWDKDKEMDIAMRFVAMAFATTTRDLGWSKGETGATKADAETQDSTSSGLGRAEPMADMEQLLASRLLPKGITLKFAPKNYLEELKEAEIQKLSAEARAIRIQSGEITPQEAREIAARQGDLPAEFMDSQTVLEDDNNTAPAGASPVDGPPLDGVPQVEAKTRATYERVLKSLVNQYRKGTIDKLTFKRLMRNEIEKQFDLAWRDGARVVEANPNDGGAYEELQRLIDEELTFVQQFADAVQVAEVKAVTMDDIRRRVGLWVNRFLEIKNRAMIWLGGDKRLKWIHQKPLKLHDFCTDCLALDGWVLTASEWKRVGVYPQDRRLACAGFECDCELIPTTEAVTRAPFPTLSFPVG